MEKANGEKIKEIFLAAFVLVCVGLILALWVNAFSEKDVDTPYFYRGVPELSGSFGMTGTAVAEQPALETVSITPEPTHLQPTVTPTSTPDFILNFTPEADN